MNLILVQGLPKTRLENLGLIGNSQFSALVHSSGEIVWCCLPRFDSEPLFSTLLDSQEGGRFRIGPADREAGTQRYAPNTNILETTFQNISGHLCDGHPQCSRTPRQNAPQILRFELSNHPFRSERIKKPPRGRRGWARRSRRTPLGLGGRLRLRCGSGWRSAGCRSSRWRNGRRHGLGRRRGGLTLFWCYGTWRLGRCRSGGSRT